MNIQRNDDWPLGKGNTMNQGTDMGTYLREIVGGGLSKQVTWMVVGLAVKRHGCCTRVCREKPLRVQCADHGNHVIKGNEATSGCTGATE